ncbi:MAG TPA: murein biosynthesis integral membrane protein MurJ [Anaerolineaceae bacterium]|uniref:Probable lipid II flippase MurJ n=1 Tax=Anaerolinea thermophila TaxID=167964 RepID=A0A101FXZ0_9CHLR|nr:MAG: Virulence factor MviN [Anaerolinea thermophila]HAF61048.1 murein biosynthesis integral membrane protein MurJ [Anaerolineaceae bacterium]
MPEKENSIHQANHQIARAAGTVMVAYIISNLAGLLAKTLTAKAFGTGADSEAFYAANRFSEILFNLVAGGALGSAFIPTFTGFLVKKDHEGAWKLASAIINWVLLILTIISILAMIFSQQVVHYILAPGFSTVSLEKELLTAQLLRIQLPSAIIFGLSGLVMGILNAHQSFFVSSLAPGMYQLGWIFGALVLAPRYGVYGLSYGILIGASLHLLVQIPRLLRLPHVHYHAGLGGKNPAVKEVGRLMAPRLLGVAVVQLNFLVNTYLASLQPEGSVTAISLAFSLMLMPQAAIAQSISIASLPTFSAQVAAGKLDEMRSSFTSTLRMILFLAIPATVGLVLMRSDIVRVLYERGEFTAQSTTLVAWALLWYALGLVGHCIVEITSRAFYAQHDTKTPVLVGVGAMSLNLILSILFSRLFTSIGWLPHGGLALANTTATLLEAFVLLLFMNKRMHGLDNRNLKTGVIKAIVASAVMAVVVLLGISTTWGVSYGLQVVLTIVIAAVVYTSIMYLLKVEEIRSLIRALKRKLQRA